MRKLKVKCKRIISILLVAALLMGSLSPYVYAADVTGHVTGAADVMLEGDAYDLPGVEEDLLEESPLVRSGAQDELPDSEADVVTTEEMEATLPLGALTGDWSEDLLRIAQSQTGICESTRNYQTDISGTVHPYSRYGDWGGMAYGKWDAAFASFCICYANIPDEDLPRCTGSAEWLLSLRDRDAFLASGTYTPCPGDLVFIGPEGALEILTRPAAAEGIEATEIDDTENTEETDTAENTEEIENTKKAVRMGFVLRTYTAFETDPETGDETEIPVMDVITGDAAPVMAGEYIAPDSARVETEDAEEGAAAPDSVRVVPFRMDAPEVMGYAALPLEHSEQTMEARIYKDASMEALAEDPADGIRLVGDLPDGGYAAAYPVDAAPSNGAKSWLAYEISLFDRDGNRVQPSHGAVRLEFYGLTVGEAIAQSGGLSFYHVTSSEEGAQETLAAYLENGDAAAKLEVLDGDEGAAGSGVVYCEAEGFSVYVLGGREAQTEEEIEAETPVVQRRGAPVEPLRAPGDGDPATAPTVQGIYYDGMIVISNYRQLSQIGTNTEVTDSDRDEENYGSGHKIHLSGTGTQEDPNVYLTYSNSATYFLTNDIALPTGAAWSVPDGFEGTFTSAAANGDDNSVLLKGTSDPAVYDSENHTVYYYNRYQMAAATDGDSNNDAIHANDFDPVRYGTGAVDGSYTGTGITYYVSERFTAKTEFDATDYIYLTDDNGNTTAAIKIYTLEDLGKVGIKTGEQVISETTRLNGVTLTKKYDYPLDGVYCLMYDIELPSKTGWNVPEDFIGTFTSEDAKGHDNSELLIGATGLTGPPVYQPVSGIGNKDKVYYYNVFQIAAGNNVDIYSNDFDPLRYGTGDTFNLIHQEYDTNKQYILSKHFTSETEFDITEYSTTVSDDQGNPAIVIDSYEHLKLVGLGRSVIEDNLNGVTRKKIVRYPSDAAYYLADDILLEDDGWQLPADFEGSFIGHENDNDYGTARQRVFNNTGNKVYIQNIYQLEVLGLDKEARGEIPVCENDWDPAGFGTGNQFEYSPGIYVTYKKDSGIINNNDYYLSKTFTNTRVEQPGINDEELIAKLGDIANTDLKDGRDFFGQTSVKIGGKTYILIGNRQQLDAIGTDVYVHEPVYKVEQSRNSIFGEWVDGSVELVYPGDADLVGYDKTGLTQVEIQERQGWIEGVYTKKNVGEGDSTQPVNFSKKPLFVNNNGDYHSLGIESSILDLYHRTVYCASDGHGSYDTSAFGRNSGSGPLKYSKDANYIIFRDIDMRVHAGEDTRNSKDIEQSPVWRPLMFTGTMIGAKIYNTRAQGGKIWNPAKTEITATDRPEISYININPEPVPYLGVNTCLDLEVQEGVGFFGTISSDIDNSTYNETQAEVRNLKLIHGIVTNRATYSKVQQSLLSIVTGSLLGRLLDELVGILLSALTGKEIDLTLQDLLDTRQGDPNNLATGAFAGKVVGQAIVEECEVECFSVNTVATLYETGSLSINNEVGGKIVGKGGFVGHVEGTAAYSGLSSALNSVTTLLERILNMIPGLGLGDLITLLLRNVLAVSYLTPTGYNAPEISNCTVSKTVLSDEDNKYGVGGFAGSVEGVSISDCGVKDCDYLTVNAEMFGGGFAGVVRDGVITTTLSGLNMVVAQSLYPNGELVGCTIENSDIYVKGGSVLGGFVGALANSYAFNNTVDEDSRLIVKSEETDGDYVGGFAGEALLGSAFSLGEHIQSATDLLSTVTGLLTGVLGSGDDQALLDVAGVAPSAIMGCQLNGSVEVGTGGKYAGGILGYGTGTLIARSEEAYIRKLHKYEKAETALPVSTPRGNMVSNLVSVSADSYAGGIAGYMESANAGGLLGSTVGIGNFLKFTICDTAVSGISLDEYQNTYYAGDREKSICDITDHHAKFESYDQNVTPDPTRVKDGYTVTATRYYAGGGLGWAVGGDVYDISLTELQEVTADNYAGGFVGATGPGDLIGSGGLNLRLLGIDLVNASNLLSIGKGVRTTYTRANVTGIDDGFTVEETGRKTDPAEADYTAGGYAGLANSVTVTDCHVGRLNSVKANMTDGIAGGFVGKSAAGGLASLLDEGNAEALKALTVDGLLGAVPYMIPKFEGDDVTYVNDGYVEGDTAGGFAGDFQSGFVNKAIRDEVVDAEHEVRNPSLSYLKYPEDTFAETDVRNEETVPYSVGTPAVPWSVNDIHHVHGGTFAGGWGGKVYSGALASAGGGISLLSSSNAAGGSIGTLSATDLLSLAQSYVPYVCYAGVNSYDRDNGNYGFSVYAAHDGGNTALPATDGYAGGFIGYGSGIQVSYCDVNKLKTGEPSEPDALTEDDEAAYAVTGIRPDVLESQDGSNYMVFTNTPDEIPYAVAGAYYAGGYIGHMDVGSAASVGKGLQLLSGTISLTNVLDTLNVVVSTIEHSDVYGAGGGFSVIASPGINAPQGAYGNTDGNGVSHAGGFAGKISGGHIQDSDVNNFYYIIGEISAGGYVGEAVPGDVAKVLGGDSGNDTGAIDFLKNNVADLANISNLASLVQDFVPTIRNSETNCVPCGGAVRAECPTDVIAAGNTVMRGMAGGYVGHSVGAQIWGNSKDTWRSENDAQLNGNTVYLDIGQTKPNWTVGEYQGPTKECSAYRIRSVYGREYAGGYCGLMECGSTAQTGGLSLLGGLVSTNNLAGALQAVYPVIRHGQVTGPIRGTPVEVWNDWVRYVGMKGGFAPELAREGTVTTQEQVDAIAAKFIYGTHVVSGRHTYEITTYKILSGCAGGFVGSMHSGVIRDSSALDTKLVSAMRAAGGFAGEMQTKGLAELGSVSLLGIDLQLGNLLNAGSVFVPVITGSGTTGYQKGLTVQAHGDSTKAGVGCAGGYAGGVYGGQIGDKLSNGEKYPDVWIDGLRTVYGTNAIGGFAGKIAAASVLDVDTNETSESFLQSILDYVVNPAGVQNLLTLAQATYSTVKNARVSPADTEWGFVIDGEYNNGGDSEYADYAGGFVGHVEAAVIGERDNATDKAVVNGLRGVIGGYYTGGFFGYGTTGSVAQVGGDSNGPRTQLLNLIQLGNVSVLDAFRTYIYYSEVHGVEDGIRIYAHNAASAGILNTNRLSGCAGGFGGALMNGTVENSSVEDLNYIEGPEYAAGMIAYMGKGGGISAEEVSVQNGQGLLARVLRELGLDLGATAQALNIVGSTVEKCRAKGFADGFIVITTESQAETNEVSENDLIGSCAAGFTGFGDVSQIEDCEVEDLRYIMSPQIAGGFIGRTSVAYLVGVNADSPLVQLLIKILNVLIKALYLDELERVNLLNASGDLLGLKVLADGDLLYLNLFGLKLSVSLAKATGEGGEDLAIITLGSSEIALPCDSNGIKQNSADAVVNLIQANRTAVKRSSVTGVDYGYDIFGSGTVQENEEAPDVYWGYAGGFVGYNNVGHFSHDEMYLCDTVKGAAGKTGPFVGGWKSDDNYDADRLEKNNNYYRIYRGKDESLNQITTSKPAVIPLDGYDEAAGGPYNRYKVEHRVNVVTYSELQGANETGSGTRPLKAYVTSAHADLMLNTPLTPNGESEAIEPDDLKDPCAETFDLHIHKRWRDYGNLLGQRPDSIEVEVLAIDVGTQPRWQLIQTIFSESDGKAVNDTLGVRQIETRTVTVEKDGKWRLDVTGLPVAYVATVPDLDENGNQKTEPLTDEQGNTVYEQAINEDGTPKVDEDDNPVYVEDSDGNSVPVLVALTKTEVHYLQYVVTEKAVEDYKVPHYQILEDTASVIITNELDGIILPGTGADGIYKLLMLGLAIFTLGAFLFLRRYRQMRNSAV